MFSLDPEYLLYFLPILLISITIHEFFHALVADKLGDPTPRLAGRLTLNPISHLDIIGFIALIIAHFGWAKPVPINPYNFKNVRQGTMLVSIAGPLSNFFTAWILAIILRNIPLDSYLLLMRVLRDAVWINISLAIFNLIPIPPLDGSKIFDQFIPYRYMEFLRQNGLLILLVFIMFGSPLLFGVVNFIYSLLV